MKKYPLLCIVLFMTAVALTRCKKQTPLLHNIILHDKPLPIIQMYISGKWKLEYKDGGFLYAKYPARNNPYMTLTANRIIIGNDSLGVIVDTAIVWKRGETIHGYSTYFLTYSYSPGFIFPYYNNIDQIKNDTLVLDDNTYDGFTYYYTRYK